jgi:hypothetical protein
VRDEEPRAKGAPKARPRRGRKAAGPRVHLHRLGRGEAVAAVSAVLLFGLTFLDWFRGELAGGQNVSAPDIGGSAWESLDLIPLLLLVAIVATLAATVLKLSGARARLPVAPNAVVAVLGGLATLLIVLRLLDTPDVDLGGLTIDTSPQLGAFLGLIAAAGIACGGYTAMRAEGGSFGAVADGLARGPAPKRRREPPASRKRSRSSSG